MGNVYHGNLVPGCEPVAIKVMPFVSSKLMIRKMPVERVKKDLVCEVTQLCRLAPHPNIIKMYDVRANAMAAEIGTS